MNTNQNPLETTIPNWSMFQAKKIAINIFKKKYENTFVYTSGLLFWLHDGNEDSELTVTVFTDVVTKDPKQTALIVAEYASSLFENISSFVYVFGEEGDIIEEFDLNLQEIDEDIKVEDFDIGY